MHSYYTFKTPPIKTRARLMKSGTTSRILGNPRGRRYILKPLVSRLSELLGLKKVQDLINAIPVGGVMLFENVVRSWIPRAQGRGTKMSNDHPTPEESIMNGCCSPDFESNTFTRNVDPAVMHNLSTILAVRNLQIRMRMKKKGTYW
ncbi:hypothetical protein C5167_000370 [Papaver somniferum]|uniref:Uncharacterized protein n=1 Tax=Papaver somniferum TaxID=3469 RepID=A0A4Y7KWK2_PAPSO|nr:hypothetical protein C5167_000370 [Papaver somniferum]